MSISLPTVCIVGLGYVGLPLAVRSAEKNYPVIGFDINTKTIASLQSGKSHFYDEYVDANLAKFPFEATMDATQIKKADIVLVCVPTPVDEFHNPDLTPVISSMQTVAANLKSGALVVLESTVNPGVSEEIVVPIFEAAGWKVGETVYIAHCPERINPGDPKWNVTNIPRVVGSFDTAGLTLALNFYRTIVDGEIRPMKSIREAEAVKIVENSFRDINIAFVNELALSFDKLGIDVKDVIEGASTKPFAFMAHFPSCGVGGHCIPVDPYYLIERAKRAGFDHKFLRQAREINNFMPEYTVELLQDALNAVKKPINGTKVGVLGLAYKANIADLRESPSFEIIKHLKKHQADIITFDPFVLEKSSVKTLEEILDQSEALIIATNHRAFIETLTPELLEKHHISVVIDGKNCLNKNAFRESKIIYKGIGR
ncbi:MAG: nucleotide sugar dehydrogenase [Candidatus Moraniibacteriota bacterium]